MSRAGDSTLAQAIGDLHRLPSPRGAALELLRLFRDENASVGDVARVAATDPALASRLIHAANGAASGSAPKTGSIAAATMRLGFTATRQIALAFSLVNDYRRGVCKRFDYTVFWNESLLRGLAARAVAARLGTGDPHEALACGLLAEIGKLALATAQPAAYGELLELHGQRGARLQAAERERFAIDHGALGSALLDQWKVPAGLVRSVDGYFDPPLATEGPDRAVRRMAWTLILAETIAQACAAPAGERAAWTHLALDGAARLGADASLLDEAVAEVAREALSWAQLLKLPAPALAAPDFPGDAETGSGAPGHDAGLRILLVEDDESDRFIVRLLLEKAGHQVSVAENGKEAIESVLASAPQVVMTDLDMPSMDGCDLCRTLRETKLGACLYVIVLTGRERHQDLVECIRAGANDFVAKSAPHEVLLARVDAAARAVRCIEAQQNEIDAVRNLATGFAIERQKIQLDARQS